MTAETGKPKDLPENPLPWGFREAVSELDNERYADIVDGIGVYVAQYLNVDSARLICNAVNNYKTLVAAAEYFVNLVMKHAKTLEGGMTEAGCAQMYSVVSEVRRITERNKQCRQNK